MAGNKVLVIDATKCRGCLSCVVACATKNAGVGDLTRSRIQVTPFWEEAFFVPTACFQCEKPYCAQVCPAQALKKNRDSGVVELNKEKCVGCKLCVAVCPFGNMAFVTDVPSKCDLCGGDPICVKSCAEGALELCDSKDIGTSRRTRVSEIVLESQKGLLAGMDVPQGGTFDYK